MLDVITKHLPVLQSDCYMFICYTRFLLKTAQDHKISLGLAEMMRSLHLSGA